MDRKEWTSVIKEAKPSEDLRAKEKVTNYHLAHLFTFQSIVLTKAKHLYSRHYPLPLTHSIFKTDKQILTVPLSFLKNSNRINSYNSPAFNVNLSENHVTEKNQHGKRRSQQKQRPCKPQLHFHSLSDKIVSLKAHCISNRYIQNKRLSYLLSKQQTSFANLSVHSHTILSTYSPTHV